MPSDPAPRIPQPAPPRDDVAAPAWAPPPAATDAQQYGSPPYQSQPYPAPPFQSQPYPGQAFSGPVFSEPGYGGPPQEESRSRGMVLLIVAACVAGIAALGLGGWALIQASGSGSDDAGEPAILSDPAAPPTTPDGQAPTSPATEPDGPPPVGSALRPVAVTATCQAPPGIDSAGNTITYDPDLTLDGQTGTAWRCAGSAVGERLVFDFGRTVTITSVGLVPGYAKVDPFDGTDRFTENRTVTGVSWQFDDGSALDQVLPSPQPFVQSSELSEPVTTQRVVLVIASTGNDAAERDFTAISDVEFAGY